jgi:hypothetical protein
MKVLIAIGTACGQRSTHQQMRDGWLKDCPVDHKFFSGHFTLHPELAERCPIEQDEVFLDVADGLENLLWKIDVLTHEWALERGYDFIFHCHNDTYVCVPRLLVSGFENYDWSGNPWGRGRGVENPGRDAGHEFACPCLMVNGASGVWYSRKAMEFLVKTLRENPNLYLDMEATAEDWRVARYLEGHFERGGDVRYSVRQTPRSDNNVITYHHVLGGQHSVRIAENFKAIHDVAKNIKKVVL